MKAAPLLGPVLRRASRWHYHWKRDPARHIRKALAGRRDLVVVQIGSNDGALGDPIHDLLMANPSWSALLVEPVPFLFKRLKQTYAGRLRTTFAQVAIGEESGSATFYHLSEKAREAMPDLPPWHDQLGSFNPDHIEKLLGHRVAPYIMRAPIQTMRLEDLFTSHGIEKLDLLHIDTEGYDWNILKQLDLSKWNPEVILFEHAHLSPATKEEARASLQAFYTITDLGSDYFCQIKRGAKS